MQKASPEEKPLLSAERSVSLMILMIAASVLLCVGAYLSFTRMMGIGFALVVPAVLLSFQTLWLLLNPFALVFDDKLQIKQSWFHQKDFYFNDLQSMTGKNGKIYLTFTDGEIQKLGIFGLRKTHLGLLLQSCIDRIAAHKRKRNSLT